MSRFMGLPYPIVPNPKGFFHKELDVETIKADLLILILTNFGERVMLPEYGTDLRSLIFDPNDSTLADRAREMIIQSISRWEPRITIEAIDIITMANADTLNSSDDLTELEGILSIRISFLDPNNIQDVQELVLQVPLNGA